MKHIVSINFSLGPEFEKMNFDRVVDFNGHKIRISQYSAGPSLKIAKSIIKKLDGDVDVFCLSGLPPKIKYDNKFFVHPEVQQLKSQARNTPIVDGQNLKEIYIPWAIRQFDRQNPQKLSKKKVGIYSGVVQKNLIEVLEELNCRIVLTDPYYYLRLPFNIHSGRELDTFLKFAVPIFRNLKLRKNLLPQFSMQSEKKSWANKFKWDSLSEFFQCDVFVGHYSNIRFLDFAHLRGKSVILDFAPPEFLRQLKEVGVQDVVTCLPQICEGVIGSYALFEGLLLASEMNRDGEIELSSNDILEAVDTMKLAPQLIALNRPVEVVQKFAFIVHPLSSTQIFRHPKLKWAKKISKKIERPIEELLGFTPGFYWGSIDGIISEKNGNKVVGEIYMLASTPRKLVESEPEDVYQKIIDLCYQAKGAGAKIIGLGAYTKIVGDAGLTVSKRSPIPVTTGNSLSAAATLWAAKLAVEKMGLVEIKNDVNLGRVMIIGATGSIGAVSAKILCQSWKEMVLVAPKAHKLLELKEEILKINNKVKVFLAVSPEDYLDQTNLIITSTSGRGEKVLDIKKVRPGCVICDVARPFDISEKEALSRPDVLVLASGEVQLPGPVQMNVDLALEKNLVYACLAETALLALENRFESFTLTRHIHYQKVMEIDRLAREHGVKLSSIMGHHGVITDEEIALCLEHVKKNKEILEHEL